MTKRRESTQHTLGSRGLGTNTGETREGCAVGTQSRRETMVEKDKGRGQRERAERRAGKKKSSVMRDQEEIRIHEKHLDKQPEKCSLLNLSV